MAGLSRGRVAGAVLAVVALAAIVAGLVLLGSPAQERARRLDERRVQDLLVIAGAVDLYWTRRGALPSSLDDLSSEPGAKIAVADPRTSQAYEYRPVAERTYELCARFEAESPASPRGVRDEFWSHGAGRQCFSRDARKVG